MHKEQYSSKLQKKKTKTNFYGVRCSLWKVTFKTLGITINTTYRERQNTYKP